MLHTDRFSAADIERTRRASLRRFQQCAAGALLLLIAAFPAAAQTCDPPVARVISLQGTVEARRANQAQWVAVALDERLCSGDSLRTQAFSRAALALPDETVTRLDQNTAISFPPPTDDRKTWLDVLEGALHIITRDRRALKILTPFADAGIEGTEFLVTVTSAQASILVFEGQVTMEGSGGAASAGSGEQVSAGRGAPPAVTAVVRPRDAVQWTLYYPPVALAAPGTAPTLTQQAAAALAVGRVEEARQALEQALREDAANATALALRAIIALTQNDRELARSLAEQAVAADPASAAALIARSYVQQSDFDLSGALASLQAAVAAEPGDALARSRLAELWLAVGDAEQAITAAEAAVAADPALSLPRTVLGFAYLARVDTARARAAFGEAIRLDSASPLPRLGLGLALIRDGELTAGREQIDIAVILDPGNALIRSYIGKAYYEEKRDGLAATQLGIAKELDPLDPTAFFYDAIRKQTINQPVEALADLRQSIELNDNRAVYRSRLLLDQDLAARSASQGRIYSDLDFEELALREGWRSVATDPGNFSGHRLLADTYDSLPRHEIARVNELFRSQLLQPTNVTPVPARLGQASLFLSTTAGPSQVSFNEFSPLFNRDQAQVQVSGVSGGNDTWGDEVTVAAVWDRLSFSLGQYHLETDGFRENNDSEQDVLNGFFQYELSEATSVLMEIRATETDEGDLTLLFDPTLFSPTFRQTEDTDSVRAGLRHAFSQRSQLLVSLLYQDADIETLVTDDINSDDKFDGYTAEIQHIFRGNDWNLVSGLRRIEYDQDQVFTGPVFVPQPPFMMIETTNSHFTLEDTTGYVYSNIGLPESVDLTLGASWTSIEARAVDEDQINPKIGVVWRPFSDTTVRAAAFRTLQPATFSQSNIQPFIEPTDVAGFNQFFSGGAGEEVWRYGFGIDQRITNMAIGTELSKRDIETPLSSGQTPDIFEIGSTEKVGRVYWYWTPPWSDDFALRAEYRYDKQDADGDALLVGTNATKIQTDRFVLGASYFAPWGISLGLTGTYLDQQGDFVEFLPVPPFVNYFTDDDEFWLFDASISYRLPKRYGLISITANNLFDEKFRFQDLDPENPRVLPERVLFLKFTLDFTFL